MGLRRLAFCRRRARESAQERAISKQALFQNRLSTHLTDRLLAADPALSRLRIAARALFALTLTVMVLVSVHQVRPLPVAAYGLAILLSFIGTIGIREVGWRRQTVTRALAGLIGASASILAGALAPQPLVADIVFLSIIFVSVYIRRYGMRWLGVGLVAFMAYFMGDYMHPPPSEAGFMLLAAAVALGSAQLASTLLFTEDPERDFRRALRTIDHRINLILRHLLQASVNGKLPPDDRMTVRAQMTELREILLMAEGFVPQITPEGWAVDGATADLAGGLIDLLLAVERLVRYRERELPPPEALHALLTESGPTVAAAHSPTVAFSGEASQLLHEVRRARARINLALGPPPSPIFQRAAASSPAAVQAALCPRRAGIPAAFHRPIQVTVACGLALAAGLMLSPTRWYWAVITAYLVFNNTRTRADTALRALNRAAGTLGGVVAGTLLATLLHGHSLAAGLLIPIVFFLAVYNLQASYGWMIFFFTNGLALLYGLMGMFTPELLFLRLSETLVGGLCGIVAAFLIFPVRTGGAVDAAMKDFLDALDEVMAAAGDKKKVADDITNAALKLDHKYGALAIAVRPLGGPWSVVTKFGSVRTKLLLLVSCAHWARVLVRALADGSATEEERDILGSLTVSAMEKTARLKLAGTSWFAAGDTPEPVPHNDPAPSTGALKHEAAIGALEAINDLLERAVAQLEPRQSKFH